MPPKRVFLKDPGKLTLRIPKRKNQLSRHHTCTDPKDRPAACTLAEWHMMDVTQLRRCRDGQKKNAWRKNAPLEDANDQIHNIYVYINIFFNRHTCYAMHVYMYSVLFTLYISFSDVLCLHTSPHEHPLTVHLYMPDVFMMHLIRS